ncbi:hypothetical protein [Stenotrophomonas phage CM2]
MDTASPPAVASAFRGGSLRVVAYRHGLAGLSLGATLLNKLTGLQFSATAVINGTFDCICKAARISTNVLGVTFHAHVNASASTGTDGIFILADFTIRVLHTTLHDQRLLSLHIQVLAEVRFAQVNPDADVQQ